MTDGAATGGTFGATLGPVVRGRFVRAFLAVTVALVGLASVAPPVARAAACTGGTITQICNGTVSPAAGTTSTTFTFSVVYQDAKSRRPCFVQVTIVGIGTFDMGPDCSSLPKTDLANGTTFTYSTTLPVGSYAYSFTGGHGGTTKDLTNPTPSRVTVTAPTPTPTPKPTPTPTPRPTPTPTPRPTATPPPTPRPTPKPTARPTAKPTPKPGRTAKPTPVPRTTSPTDEPSASARPSASPVVGGGLVGGAGDGGAGSSGSDPGGPPAGPLVVLALVAAAIGLSGGMIAVARRRRRGEEPGPHDGAAAPRGTVPGPARPVPPAPSPRPVAAAASAPASASPRAPAPDPRPAPAFAPTAGAVAQIDPAEVGVPRWRRASLKEARARSERVAAPAHRSVTFGSTAPAGVERSVVRYDLVPILDSPDEVTGLPVGDLQAGDEVETVGRRGVWTEVRTPRGAIGWVHRTTLQAIVASEIDDLPLEGVSPGPAPAADDDAGAPPDLDMMLARIVAARQAAAAAEVAEVAGHPAPVPPAPGQPPAADPGHRPSTAPALRPAGSDAPA